MSCSEKQLRIQLETLNEQLERLRRENDTLKLDKCELSERLTAEQRQAWVDAMKPVWSQFEGDVGADNIAAAQEINASM